jgi:hypothetical protein
VAGCGFSAILSFFNEGNFFFFKVHGTEDLFLRLRLVMAWPWNVISSRVFLYLPKKSYLLGLGYSPFLFGIEQTESLGIVLPRCRNEPSQTDCIIKVGGLLYFRYLNGMRTEIVIVIFRHLVAWDAPVIL